MGSVLVGLVMVVGLLGVVVPLLPGTALVLGAGVAWAVLVQTEGAGRWVVVAVMAALFVAGVAAKYALPGKRLSAQLPRTTLLCGALAAVVGFLVLPPFGLLVGGVAGVYLAEARRVGGGAEARRSTVQVLKAVGLGILAELTAGVLMVGTWLAGLVAT
ncbi:MAG: hypothetical protein JWN08_1725 [Frankiales bacterium]|jgi:uncharacterized protein YqgC (DUF456 family)|nr:hypothetical protein [Frankiales bacterium]